MVKDTFTLSVFFSILICLVFLSSNLLCFFLLHMLRFQLTRAAQGNVQVTEKRARIGKCVLVAPKATTPRTRWYIIDQ
ncbi:hypothetical protein ANTQUA_LOCUS5846 [Anthophora quadrimaculata]